MRLLVNETNVNVFIAHVVFLSFLSFRCCLQCRFERNVHQDGIRARISRMSLDMQLKGINIGMKLKASHRLIIVSNLTSNHKCNFSCFQMQMESLWVNSASLQLTMSIM